MGIMMKTSQQEIGRMTQQQLQAIEDGIIRRLEKVAYDFVTDARDQVKIDTGAFGAIRKAEPHLSAGKYLPDTGNLQSSIGFFILKDGVVISRNFGSETEWAAAGMAVLTRVETLGGYQLIGVAGMDYASYLESKGFNVITSQSVIALESVEKSVRAFAAQKGLEDVNISTRGVTTQWNQK